MDSSHEVGAGEAGVGVDMMAAEDKEESLIDTFNGLFKVTPTNSSSTSNNTIVFPDELMELILSYVPVNEHLSIRQVCRQWRRILATKAYWKLMFQHCNMKLSNIPKHIAEKENGWMALYSIVKHRITTRNFIQNGSGQDEFQNWMMVHNGGSGIAIENIPVGCPPLPEDPESPESSCFVTSFEWGELLQSIRLSDIGLTPVVMKMLMPFELAASVMVASRGVQGENCGVQGLCTFQLNGVDSFSSSISRQAEFILKSGANWKKIEFGMTLGENLQDFVAGQMLFTLRGKDTRWWLGHYGAKFARAALRINLLSSGQQPDADMATETNELLSNIKISSTIRSELSR